jgi:LPS export ABC transporter protein LptC
MKNKKTIFFVIGALLVMAGIFAWLVSDTGEHKKSVATGTLVAPREIENTSLHEENNGKKAWDLQVDSVVYDAVRDVNVLKGVAGKFYQEDGSNITIESETGEIDLQKKTVMLTGHPKGVFSNGGELTADKLTWFSKEQKIIADGSVKITKDDVVATAQKATMEIAMEHLRLEGEALVQKGVGQ